MRRISGTAHPFLALSIAVLALAGWASPARAKETIIHRFIGGSDGSNPRAGLTSDPDGNLYGTSYYGGTGSCNVNNEFLGCGTVFELTPTPEGGWNETVLYSFTNSPSDGQYPVGGVIRDEAGNLYGTTGGGGTANCDYGGCGTIFELTPPATPIDAWTETILYNFQGGADGFDPLAGLVFDKHGALYGTTVWGGNSAGICSDFALGCGTVFKLAPSGSGGKWLHIVLYSFKPTNDGNQPEAGLVFDKSGALYGTTTWGGFFSDYCGSGCGTVFKLTPPTQGGGAWTETLLLQFSGDDGASPLGGLIFDQVGNLYGTTSVGMSAKGEFNGTVFQLLPPGQVGGNWKQIVLHRFGVNGGPAYPAAGVILDGAGNIYGTTQDGGEATFGTVFRLAPPVSQGGVWTEATLHQFNGGSDGSFPQAPLIFGKGPALYGTTYDGGDTTCSMQGYNNCGIVFKISF